MATLGSSPPASLFKSRCAQLVLSPPHRHCHSTQHNLLPHQGLKPSSPAYLASLTCLMAAAPGTGSHPTTRHPQLTQHWPTCCFPCASCTSSTPTLPISTRTGWPCWPPRESSLSNLWPQLLLQGHGSLGSVSSVLDCQLPIPGSGQLLISIGKSFIPFDSIFPAGLQATPGPGQLSWYPVHCSRTRFVLRVLHQPPTQLHLLQDLRGGAQLGSPHV